MPWPIITEGVTKATKGFFETIKGWVEEKLASIEERFAKLSGGKIEESVLPVSVETGIAPSGDETGATDAAAINAALGTGPVRLRPGGHYYINETLVFAHLLDARGATIQATAGNFTMARNRGSVSVASAEDGATTKGSNVIKTALAKQANIGQMVTVDAANAVNEAGIPFTGLISAVKAATNELEVTDLDGSALVAGATVAAKAVRLYTIDKEPRLLGGNWIKSKTSGSHCIIVNFADDPVIEPESISAPEGIQGGHGIDWGAVRRGFCAVTGPNNFTGVGIQVKGPTYGSAFGEAFGITGDDLFAITASDWPGLGLTSGNVINVTVAGVSGESTTATLFKTIAGAGNTVDGIKVATGIFGHGQQFVWWVGDDTGNASTTGGTYGTVELGHVKATTAGEKEMWEGEKNGASPVGVTAAVRRSNPLLRELGTALWVGNFLNSWANANDGLDGNAAYYITPGGVCHVQGTINSGVSGKPAFKLPVAPATRRIYSIWNGTIGASVNIDVDKEGNVTPEHEGVTHLNGIQFLVSQ